MFKVMPGGMVTLSGLRLFRKRTHLTRAEIKQVIPLMSDQDQLDEKQFPPPLSFLSS